MDQFSSPTSPSFNSAVVPVSKLKRFINALVDGILIAIVVQLLARTIGLGTNFGLSFLMNAAIQFAYYFALENGSGRTIGKRVTGTKVVMADGSKPTTDAIMKRSLWRLIPLVDAVSFLINDVGLHDKFSDTRVVDAQ